MKTPLFFAEPCDLTTEGFLFQTASEYAEKAATLRTKAGQPVEEFQIMIIDGQPIDCQLFDTLEIRPPQLIAFFTAMENWADQAKINVMIVVGEVGDEFDITSDDPGKLDVQLYRCDSLTELAVQFVDDGLFGEIPKPLENYIDYVAIGRDLGMDYGYVDVAGARYFYRYD